MSLKELLGEELYNQVIEKAGDKKLAVVSDGNWFPKDKFDQVNEDNKLLKEQIDERDTQLEELKKVDAGALQQRIDELQEENQTTATEYQEKLDKQTFDFTLDKALTGAKVRNSKAVKALLDTEKIKLDGETLLNLDDQLEGLKESDPYLFEQEESTTKPPTIVAGGNPRGGGEESKSLSEMSYQELTDIKENNPARFAELTK